MRFSGSVQQSTIMWYWDKVEFGFKGESPVPLQSLGSQLKEYQEDPSPFPTPSLSSLLSRPKTSRARWVSPAVAFPSLWVFACRLGWYFLALLGADDKTVGRGRLQAGLVSGCGNHQLGLTALCPSVQRVQTVLKWISIHLTACCFTLSVFRC